MVLMYSPLGQPTEVASTMIKTYRDFKGYTFEDPRLLKINPNSFKMPTKPSSKDEPTDFSGDKLDLNTASKQEIMDLPGIGTKIAEKIIEDRPILSWTQLEGISDRVNWDELKDEVTF